MKKGWIALVALAVAGFWGYSKLKPGTPVGTQTGTVATEKPVLHLYAMSDYFPEAVLKKFEAENGCEVKYDNFASNEELLAKLQAGATGYDVIVPSDYAVRALINSGLLIELDKSKIPNTTNLASDFIDVPFDVGSKFSVPYTWGTTGLIYNSKHVKPKSESWDIVFDKAYAGHIAMLDDVREVFGALLRKNGQSGNSVDEKVLKAAQETLKKLKPSIRLFSSDPKQHVLAGDIWIAHIYSGDAAQLTREKPELKYFVPKEGGVIWIDTLAIPKGARNVELAHKFINMILEPQVAKTLTEELLYASPNKAIESLIEDKDLKPSQIRKMTKGQLEFLEDLGPANEKLDQLWSEAKAL